MQTAIAIKDLSVVIDKKQILSGVSVDIPQAKIVGLLGPSGAGKTTLIRAILGLQKASTGSVYVLGRKAGSRILRSDIGYVTQAPSVYGDLTVLENLHYFADLVGANRQEVSVILQNTELVDYQDQLVEALSGGQRARVSLSAALLGSPRLLLLDEPTVGLDPVLRQKLWEQFKTLAEAGTTILVSSHVMSEADRCDSLLFMRDGTVLIADTRDDILSKTKTDSMEEAFLRLALGETR